MQYKTLPRWGGQGKKLKQYKTLPRSAGRVIMRIAEAMLLTSRVYHTD